MSDTTQQTRIAANILAGLYPDLETFISSTGYQFPYTYLQSLVDLGLLTQNDIDTKLPRRTIPDPVTTVLPLTSAMISRGPEVAKSRKAGNDARLPGFEFAGAAGPGPTTKIKH